MSKKRGKPKYKITIKSGPALLNPMWWRDNYGYEPPQPTALGPNQLAWCRDNLRGFSMEAA